MQATEYFEVSKETIPQMRELLKTIVDAASALAQLLSDTESKQRFEFVWGI